MPDQPKLYVIGDEHGFIKIGISHKPESRLRELQVGNPNKLSLLAVCDPPDDDHSLAPDWGMRQVEWMLHDYMRSMGLWASGEWFVPSVFTTIAANALSLSLSDGCVAIRSLCSAYYNPATPPQDAVVWGPPTLRSLDTGLYGDPMR